MFFIRYTLIFSFCIAFVVFVFPFVDSSRLEDFYVNSDIVTSMAFNLNNYPLPLHPFLSTLDLLCSFLSVSSALKLLASIGIFFLVLAFENVPITLKPKSIIIVFYFLSPISIVSFLSITRFSLACSFGTFAATMLSRASKREKTLFYPFAFASLLLHLGSFPITLISMVMFTRYYKNFNISNFSVFNSHKFYLFLFALILLGYLLILLSNIASLSSDYSILSSFYFFSYLDTYQQDLQSILLIPLSLAFIILFSRRSSLRSFETVASPDVFRLSTLLLISIICYFIPTFSRYCIFLVLPFISTLSSKQALAFCTFFFSYSTLLLPSYLA